MKIHVTVDYNVYIGEDEIEAALQEQPTEKYEDIVKSLAMSKINEPDGTKIKDIIVHYNSII